MKAIGKSGLIFAAVIAGHSDAATAQEAARSVNPTVQLLIAHEQGVADAVVRGGIVALDTVYAESFQFSHGTGTVQSKTEWLVTVERAKATQTFHSRSVRDQTGEVHGDVAILTGWIDVRANRDYSVRYVRVYQLREGRWLMLSHRRQVWPAFTCSISSRQPPPDPVSASGGANITFGSLLKGTTRRIARIAVTEPPVLLERVDVQTDSLPPHVHVCAVLLKPHQQFRQVCRSVDFLRRPFVVLVLHTILALDMGTSGQLTGAIVFSVRVAHRVLPVGL